MVSPHRHWDGNHRLEQLYRDLFLGLIDMLHSRLLSLERSSDQFDNVDTAAGMISCAKDQPHLVEARWQWLLATDGLRFDPWERNEWPEESLEWREMRRRWDAETDTDLQPDVVLQREACRYIEEFYDLDQLALIDLTGHAIGRADGQTTLWADFAVIDGQPHRIAHSGVVRIERTSGSSDIDAAIFERVEEF
mgnify:CR=1 FL=1